MERKQVANIIRSIDVARAYADGADLQLDSPLGWIDCPSPDFSADPKEYRVKPKPLTLYRVSSAQGIPLHLVTTEEQARELVSEQKGGYYITLKQVADSRHKDILF
jgi:hypothetical protein